MEEEFDEELEDDSDYGDDYEDDYEYEEEDFDDEDDDDGMEIDPIVGSSANVDPPIDMMTNSQTWTFNPDNLAIWRCVDGTWHVTSNPRVNIKPPEGAMAYGRDWFEARFDIKTTRHERTAELITPRILQAASGAQCGTLNFSIMEIVLLTKGDSTDVQYHFDVEVTKDGDYEIPYEVENIPTKEDHEWLEKQAHQVAEIARQHPDILRHLM